MHPLHPSHPGRGLSRRSFLSTAALAAGGVAGLGSLAACGSTSEGAAAVGGGSSSGLSKLTLQSAWVSDAEFMGYFVAMDQGYYAKEGIELEYLPGGPDVIPETVLVAGQADIALTTIEQTAKLVAEEGADLKIIGVQYRKNPAGVVSLKSSGINGPQDLKGKTLALAPVGMLTFETFFTINGMSIDDVNVVPYAYDPTPLVKGEVDASGDFVTNVPFAVQEAGGDPASFLLYDYGLTLYNDTVVVRGETLEERREDLVAFLRASRAGWVENFKDTTAYIPMLKDTWGKDTGRSAANEEFFNAAQQPLIEQEGGIFSLTPEDIAANLKTLDLFGIKADESLFDTSLLDEV